jgi:hypothetical protein
MGCAGCDNDEWRKNRKRSGAQQHEGAARDSPRVARHLRRARTTHECRVVPCSDYFVTANAGFFTYLIASIGLRLSSDVTSSRAVVTESENRAL